MRLRFAVLVLVGAQPVLADPVALPPPAPDPPTIHARRDYNVSINPLGMLLGFYGMSAEVRLSRQLAVRLDGDRWVSHVPMNVANWFRFSGYEIGASTPLYPFAMYSGPFVEPGIVFRASRVMMQTETHRRAWVGPELLLGMHLTFRSGFSVAIALGLAKPMVTEGVVRDVELEGYLRFGAAF